MKRSPEERAQTERLESAYTRLQSSVMLSIETCVCGRDYGGNSWTTRAEADRMSALMGLKPGLRLMDVGAGSGWPGLYMAKNSGCDLVLTDLPLAGLRIAVRRAKMDRIAGDCRVVCADAADLPFPDAGFDALSHSDLLCCLRPKRAVLESCSRVTRRGGRMVFTVICLAPGLSPANRRRAIEKGPEFVESDTDYSTLLEQTGWMVYDRQDLSFTYAASCRRQAEAEAQNKDQVIAVLGAPEYADRQAKWAATLSALDEGLLLRELFVATPA